MALPPIHYINLDSSTERKKLFESQMTSLGWSATRFSAITPESVEEYCTGIDKVYMQPRETACLISHLEVIRIYGSEPILVFEDDVSFETIRYWKFTLEDLIQIIPKNASVTQLAVFPPVGTIKLKKWNFFHNMSGCVAYLITPKRVKELSKAYKDGKWDLTALPTSAFKRPIADCVMYADTEAYSIPLFSVQNVVSDIWGKNTTGSYNLPGINLWKLGAIDLDAIRATIDHN